MSFEETIPESQPASAQHIYAVRRVKEAIRFSSMEGRQGSRCGRCGFSAAAALRGSSGQSSSGQDFE